MSKRAATRPVKLPTSILTDSFSVSREQQRFDEILSLSGELRDDPDIAELLRAAKQPHRASSRVWPAGLAVAAIIVLAWGISFLNLGGSTPVTTLVLTAAVGTQHTAELPDSSRVILNSGARLVATFTESTRTVTLLEGEATFDVNRDGREFEVRTQEGIIRVLGTVFNVQLARNGTAQVSVLEGRVRVESNKKHHHEPPIELTPGQAVDYDRRGLSTVRPADIDRIYSWHSGRVRFQEWSVTEVIDEYNRYTLNKLKVEGGEDILLSGSFTLENKEELISTLEKVYAVRIYPAPPSR